MKMTIKKTPPKTFLMKVDRIGTDTLWGSYKINKDKSAMKIAMDTNMLMSKNFAGEKMQGAFLYETAINILAQLNGIDLNEIVQDIEKFKKEDYTKFWVINDGE